MRRNADVDSPKTMSIMVAGLGTPPSSLKMRYVERKYEPLGQHADFVSLLRLSKLGVLPLEMHRQEIEQEILARKQMYPKARTTLMGHSKGALVAAMVFADQPDMFDRLLLLAPPVKGHRGDKPIRLFRGAAHYVEGKVGADVAAEKVVQAYVSPDGVVPSTSARVRLFEGSTLYHFAGSNSHVVPDANHVLYDRIGPQHANFLTASSLGEIASQLVDGVPANMINPDRLPLMKQAVDLELIRTE